MQFNICFFVVHYSTGKSSKRFGVRKYVSLSGSVNMACDGRPVAAVFALAVTVGQIRLRMDGKGHIQVTKSRSQSVAARQQLSFHCSGTGSILSAAQGGGR